MMTLAVVLSGLCVAMLTGCGLTHLFEGASVDDELLAYTKEFYQGCVDHVDSDACRDRWITVASVEAVDGYVDDIEGRVGICNTTNVGTEFAPLKLKRTVKVTTSINGKRLGHWRVKQVLFHELGHCMLDLRHGEVALMQTDRPFISKKKIERTWDAMKSEMWERARERL
jgi:hypothetical protein